MLQAPPTNFRVSPPTERKNITRSLWLGSTWSICVVVAEQAPFPPAL